MTAVTAKVWGEGTPPVEDIVHAAITLVDTHGFDALNTRRLALEMGVHRPNLYRRVTSIDELFGRMSNSIIAEAGIPDAEITDWREWLTDCAVRLHESWMRHPNAARLIFHGGAHPALLELLERLLGVFLSGDFPADEIQAVAQSYFVYVFGAIAMTGLTPQGGARMLPLTTDELAAFPSIATAQTIAAAGTRRTRTDFVAGLEVVLDGISQRRRSD